MEIKVVRDVLTENSTTGKLFVNGVFECFTLEDKVRTGDEKRIKGATAIPYGKYKVTLRKDGTVWGWMQKALPNIGLQENGIPWIANLEGEKYEKWIDKEGVLPEQFVLIHDGNYATDTEGCLLVGTERGTDIIKPGTSSQAFAKFYPKLVDAIKNKKESVTIEYVKE